MEKMKMETPDFTSVNIEKIGELFPNCITDQLDTEKSTPEHKVYRKAINFEMLKQMLSRDVVEGNEAYEFTWVGKKASMVEANKPIRKTLRPVIEDETTPTGEDSSGKPYCSTGSVDWDTTENLYIEGDNIDVLKLLQESYLGKIKMIYIDPPYNTGSDSFVYPDNYSKSSAEYDEEAGVYDDAGNKLYKVNKDTNPQFHSSWCSMIYSRLLLMRNLLKEDGVVLVSIGDKELKNLQAIMDEVFGASNQVCCFVWKSRAKPTNAGNSRFRPQKVAEYILVYSKGNPENQIFNVIPAKERTYPHTDEKGNFRTTTILTSNRGTFRRETMRFESHGFVPSEDYRWKAGKETIDYLYESNHMYINDDGIPMEKKYESEENDPLYPIYTYVDSDLSGTAENGKSELGKLVGKHHGFDTVKPVQLIKYLIQTFTKDDDIILDAFSGSATTAQAIMEQNYESNCNYKFIMIQLPEKIDEESEAYTAGFENICEIGKKRIKRVGEMIMEKSPEATFDKGFRVFKLDESNMNKVYYRPMDYTQNLLSSLENNIKSDRSDVDLLFGCLLDWGLPLSMPYTRENICGYNVHNYNDGDLIACFEEDISEEAVREIAKRKPLRAVFRDSSFANSPSKINVFEIFKIYMPEDANDITKRVRVI